MSDSLQGYLAHKKPREVPLYLPKPSLKAAREYYMQAVQQQHQISQPFPSMPMSHPLPCRIRFLPQPYPKVGYTAFLYRIHYLPKPYIYIYQIYVHIYIYIYIYIYISSIYTYKGSESDFWVWLGLVVNATRPCSTPALLSDLGVGIWVCYRVPRS